MNEKDYLDFKETKDINWTMQYQDHVYMLVGSANKKSYSLSVFLCPKKNINFKKKRLVLDEEYTYVGKTLDEAKEKMMKAKIFGKQSFQDVYQKILVIDKYSHNKKD